jgi:hypothetical protein
VLWFCDALHAQEGQRARETRGQHAAQEGDVHAGRAARGGRHGHHQDRGGNRDAHCEINVLTLKSQRKSEAHTELTAALSRLKRDEHPLSDLAAKKCRVCLRSKSETHLFFCVGRKQQPSVDERTLRGALESGLRGLWKQSQLALQQVCKRARNEAHRRALSVNPHARARAHAPPPLPEMG